MSYLVTVYHSPDSDDAFMFYPITKNIVRDKRIKLELKLMDIQTLNEIAMREEVDVSAVSFHAYAYIFNNYHILPCGASFGNSYGPKIVALKEYSLEDLKGKKVAIPGKYTSSTLAFRMLNLDAKEVEVPFNKVEMAIKEGSVDAGILIHEGQITFEKEGFFLVKDLGFWWKEKEGLPLPLGGNVIKKKLPSYVLEKFPILMKNSIEYALRNKKEALQFAKQYGRKMTDNEVEKFVSMYVNHWTLDYGKKGKEAVKRFLDEAYEKELIPNKPLLSFL